MDKLEIKDEIERLELKQDILGADLLALVNVLTNKKIISQDEFDKASAMFQKIREEDEEN